ncbi:Probable O-methyltransferase 3, partial [Linum grandiflorum]
WLFGLILEKVEMEVELLEAQAHILSFTHAYVVKMCMKCALELGIPDAILGPTSLSDLVSALQLHPSRYDAVRRLMRLLVHAGIFRQEQKEEEANEYECYYYPTLASKLLQDNDDQGARKEMTTTTTRHPPRHLFFHVDGDAVTCFASLSNWYKNGGDESATTPFDVFCREPCGYWEWMEKHPKTQQKFHEAMVGDSKLVAAALVSDCYCREVFNGVESLVDVGGGTGTMSVTFAKAFPDIKFTVFDLPHVVANGGGGDGAGNGLKNLDFVGGSMFGDIPTADAILLKWILHNWDDENCVKMLKKCRDAITSSSSRDEKKKAGKVIVIDIVVFNQATVDDKDITRLQLCFDMMMLTLFNGKERTEAEFKNLFVEAGFNGGYKIVKTLGTRSVIEVYP